MYKNKSIYDSEMPNITPGKYGSVTIRLSRGDIYVLERLGIKWMDADLEFAHPKDTLHSQYDVAYGNILVTGLGFGILTKALSEKPEVTSITVLEIEKDVIEAFLANNTLNSKVKIINSDALTYTSNEKYDCLLPDHYELQNVEWIIEDMNAIASRISHDVFWPWSIEEIFLQKMYPRDVYKNETRLDPIYNLESIVKLDSNVLYSKWKLFIGQYFNSNQYLLSISPSKLSEYVEKHAKYYY
jgi:hypothetical protein